MSLSTRQLETASECAEDEDCSGWLLSYIDKKCKRQLNSGSAHCNMNGDCTCTHSSTNSILSTCYIGGPTCIEICHFDAGYAGELFDIDIEKMEQLETGPYNVLRNMNYQIASLYFNIQLFCNT